jgi:hypothetical protein
MKRYLSLFVGCCIVFCCSTMAHAEERKDSDTSAGCPCAGDKNATETGSVGTAISVPVPLGLPFQYLCHWDSGHWCRLSCSGIHPQNSQVM